jgi:hypothetical protein
MSLIEKYGIRTAEAAMSYLNLWGWFTKQISVLTGKARIHSFASTNELWDAILEGRIHVSDQIQLRDVFITEWIPRAPGAAHMPSTASPLHGQSGWNILLGDFKKYTSGDVTYSPSKHDSMSVISFAGREFSSYGWGSVRLPVIEDSKSPVLLGAVGSEPYFCDTGIPIVTSQSVYRKFLRCRIGSNAVAATFRARFLSGGVNPARRIHEKSGIVLPDVFIDALERSLGLPECYLVLDSPLDVTFYSHDSHPVITAWTFAQAKGPFPLQLLGAICNPSEKDDLHAAVEHIVSQEHVEQRYIIEQALTEFDGQASHFRPSLTLSIDPLSCDSNAIRKLVSLAEKCIQRQLGDNYY